MQTKTEAALAGAAATVSDELDEARPEHIRPNRTLASVHRKTVNIPKPVEQGKAIPGPWSNFSASSQSDNPNACDKKTPVDQILSQVGCAVLLPIQPGEKIPDADRLAEDDAGGDG